MEFNSTRYHYVDKTTYILDDKNKDIENPKNIRIKDCNMG